MAALDYVYQDPQETYTIEQFIACQSNEEINYKNLSFIDKVNYPELFRDIHYSTYNVISDYLNEIRNEYCVNVVLTDEDMYRYMYRPKLLCNRLYNNEELYYIILLINDMYSTKQFTKRKLLMPRRAAMDQICSYIYNSNYKAINKYNKNSIIVA